MNIPPVPTVEYQESGQGEAIVFVPGSFSAGSSWRGIATPLSDRFRTVTTSLCGYGKTAERRLPGGDHMADEMDVLEAVLQQVNAPVHLVAHSFGAWSALMLAMRRPHPVLSLTLIEPTAFQMLALCGEAALSQQILDLVHRYTSDWHAGHATAVRHIIDFYGGKGTFDGYPDAVKDKLASQTATNILDWHSGFGSPITLQDLATVRVPTLIVCGGASHIVMKRAQALLAAHLPRADFKTLERANHFLIGTHAQELTALVEQHIIETSAKVSA